MITRKQAVWYEIRASWWACYISIGWLQAPVAKYFSWKVDRKMARVESHQKIENKFRIKYPHWFKNDR